MRYLTVTGVQTCALTILVDRADVEARAAAQTVERLAERPRELIDPAVVQEDQMELLRPLELPRAPRSLDGRRVDGELLAGRALGEARPEHHEGAPRGHALLDAHHRDVDTGKRGHHAGVALVGDQDDGARVRDREVRPRDPEVRLEELLPQLAPRELRERLGIRGNRALELLPEEVGDLALRLVDRWRDDARRPLLGELDAALAALRLQPDDPRLLERLVDMDLLGGHGLRLHRHPRARPAADLAHDGARLRRRRREVHPPPEALDVPDQLLEVAIEVLQRRFLDLPRPVTEALTLGEGVERLAAEPDELRRRDGQRLLEEGVFHRAAGVPAVGERVVGLAHARSPSR